MSSSEKNQDPNDKKSLKTGSDSSLKSLGMGTTLKSQSNDGEDSSLAQRLSPEGGSPPGETVYDCIAYVIYCEKHQKIAISKSERSKAVWLPFIMCPTSKTWKDSANDGVIIILSQEDSELDKKLQQKPPIRSIECLHVLRIEVPVTERYIYRLIQLIKLEQRRDFQCCKKTKRIDWISMKDVLSGNISKVWGPEVQQFGSLAPNTNIKPHGISEFSIEMANFYVPKKPPRNLEEVMLKSLGITDKDVEILYGDFLEHCFPSFFMTIDSFNDYMTKYGYERNDPQFAMLFNAFNYNKNGFLNFHELLLGLTSMEPMTIHNEGRVKFVFRYYDIDNDGYLSEQEFKKLVEDISPNASPIDIQNKVKEGIKTIGLKNNKISFNDFFKAVGALRFRGTSSLCRSAKPIVTQISKSMASRTDLRISEKNKRGFLKVNRINRGICTACRGKKYDYGLHSVVFDTNGRCVEPRRIFEPESADSEITDQRYSMEWIFNTVSIANVFIDMIKEYHRKKATSNEIGFLSAVEERASFVRYLKGFCRDLEDLIKNEERVIKINSPALVIGDIHGNIDELMKMEALLWQSIPIVSSNHVFLGNYVDFGKWGVECVIYLFALKLIAPKKVFLIRGNHEVREVQKQNSFYKECLLKYGENFGQQVWELINNVFDKLPLSVIIDELIFCSHSGIPNTKKKVNQFLGISSDLKRPQECAIAWELLCNEPSTDSSAISSGSGFKQNKKRGTGYLFNEIAIKNFLKLNGFTHFIRSNNMTNNGYAFHFSGKCLTVFSSSRFYGYENESAVIFLDNEKIRIIRLEKEALTKNDSLSPTSTTVTV